MTGKIVVVHILMMSVLIWLLPACGVTGDEKLYDRIAQASLDPGDPIPKPSDDIILTVSGDISIINDNNQLTFDIKTLEMLGLIRYKVDDPWLQKEVTYSGVLLSDLLKFAGASDSVTVVYATALDGYAVAIPIKEIEDWPVLLATQSDGTYMTVENSGPTRIIFPYGVHDDISVARNYSVWNLKSLEIR